MIPHAHRAFVTALLSDFQTASSSSSCDSTGGRFCNLREYLHGLQAIAVLLGLILLIVLIGTVIYFRRVRRMKIEP